MRNTKIKEMAKDLEGYSIDTAIDCEHVAEVLYDKGYRKAEDVATEICEFIGTVTSEQSPTSYHRGYNDACKDLVEVIKEKYTEER